LGGGDQFGVGAGVDGLEFFGHDLLPAIGFWLGFHLVDRLIGVTVVAEFLLDERLQAFAGVGDGRLGRIGSSGQGSDKMAKGSKNAAPKVGTMKYVLRQ
jgi:hypothetical protein